jgi:disulfide bond formation protein DsbB
MAQDIFDSQVSSAAAADDIDTVENGLVDAIGAASRYIALLAAWLATCGSLFFSEVLGWLPCVLCWYQRILMYPLAILIAIGILRRDDRLHLYVLPLSLFGACVSLYHYLLIKTDWLPPPTCVAGIPCTVEYLNLFGFVNIPFLALTAFLIIAFMMIASTLRPFPEPDSVEISGSIAGRLLAGRAAIQLVAVIISVVVSAFVLSARYYSVY